MTAGHCSIEFTMWCSGFRRAAWPRTGRWQRRSELPAMLGASAGPWRASASEKTSSRCRGREWSPRAVKSACRGTGKERCSRKKALFSIHAAVSTWNDSDAGGSAGARKRPPDPVPGKENGLRFPVGSMCEPPLRDICMRLQGEKPGFKAQMLTCPVFSFSCRSRGGDRSPPRSSARHGTQEGRGMGDPWC